jgi:hypothetical protein
MEHTNSHLKGEAEKTAKGMRQGYFEVQSQMADVNAYIQTSDFYNEYFFDVMAFFFLGMALFKLGFFLDRSKINPLFNDGAAWIYTRLYFS